MNYENKISYSDKIKEKEITNDSSRSIVEVTEEEYHSILQNNLSSAQKESILNKLISNIILDDEKSKIYASNIYYYYLNREGEYDEEEIDFITKYTIYLNYRRIKYDEEGKVKPGYEYVTMPKIMVLDRIDNPEDNQVIAGYAMSTVVISRELSITPWKDGDKEKLFEYIQALSHEMVHYKQDYEAKQGMLTLSSFKEIIAMANKNQKFDDSVHNYRFREIEVEAQIESMMYAVEIGRIYLPREVSAQETMLQKREQYLMEEALSFQQDDERTIALRDFYDIGSLSIAVVTGIKINEKTLLERYPQLLAFFNENGQMKSEEELLEGYQLFLTTQNNEVASIYEMFLVYIYQRDNIIQNQELRPELIEVKKMFILRQIKKEVEMLETIRNMSDQNSNSIARLEKWGLSLNEIIRQRRNRLQLYEEFLSTFESQEQDSVEIIQDLKAQYDKIIYKKDFKEMINTTEREVIDDNIKKGY